MTPRRGRPADVPHGVSQDLILSTLAGCMRKTTCAIVFGVGIVFVFGASAANAQDGATLFASICSGCHNDVTHPKGLVYNAAGNVAIIETVNAFGMGATGSVADHTSIAAYLDSVKPTIAGALVAHDTPSLIPLGDIVVSGAQLHASWQIISGIVTVSPPTKGTVIYEVKNGFAEPSFVKYTPFPGQSGTDTWTYQGTGPGGTTTIRTASVNIAAADGTFPSSAPSLNQHGLTGSWFEAATAGQGVEVEIFPDVVTTGTGLAQVSWFTFDTASGGADHQRWYTLGGSVVDGQPSAALTIYRNTGGNFAAPPTTSGAAVGTATLAFDSCTTGLLSYAFTDGSGRAGSIPLRRLTQNVTCDAGSARPTNADFALSGNWFDAATSGQGVTIEANPVSGVLFFAWYTYAKNGAGAGVAGQRWYTALGSFTPGARSVSVQLSETTGGVFDASPPAPASTAVGAATIAFHGCSALTLTYTFTGGSLSGASGSLNLTRVGPVPAGCVP